MGMSLKPDPNQNQNQNYNGYDPNMYQENQYTSQAYRDPYADQYQYQQTPYNQSASMYASSAHAADEISEVKYNLVIGACLLWGFLANVFMVKFCFDGIYDFVANNYILFFILYFVMAITGTIMIKKSDNPVVSFIGYNLFVLPLGMVITIVVNIYQMAGAGNIVTTAVGITAVVTLLMMAAGSLFPGFFLSIGRVLGISLLITVLLELILFIAGASLGIIDYIVVAIFCGYVGYDWAKANEQPKTIDNAVDSAAELYIDIVNLFLRILRILARNSN